MPDSQDKSRENNSTPAEPTATTAIRREVQTSGEVLADGTLIELIRGDTETQLKLLTWSGGKGKVASFAQYKGRVYAPVFLEPTILRALQLPSQSAPYGTTRNLFDDVTKPVSHYTALSENFVSLLCHFGISTWFPDCTLVAPCLVLVGPAASEAARVLRLLHCVCRHALLLGDLNPAGLCSLPMYLCPTLLIAQPELSAPTLRLLQTSNIRNLYVPRRGQLLDLFCPQAIHSMEPLGDASLCSTAIRIPVTPTRRQLPILDEGVLRKIAKDLQPKLLTYRLMNYARVRNSDFDVPQLTSLMRDPARSLGASIVDDPELQAGIISLLQDQDEEIRGERWTDLYSVVSEAALFLCHDGEKQSAYVGEVASVANIILKRRGETVELESRAVGEKLRWLGLSTTPRDSKGYKILLTDAVRRRIHELTRDFEVPSVQDGVARCKHCAQINGAVGI